MSNPTSSIGGHLPPCLSCTDLSALPPDTKAALLPLFGVPFMPSAYEPGKPLSSRYFPSSFTPHLYTAPQDPSLALEGPSPIGIKNPLIENTKTRCWLIALLQVILSQPTLTQWIHHLLQQRVLILRERLAIESPGLDIERLVENSIEYQALNTFETLYSERHVKGRDSCCVSSISLDPLIQILGLSNPHFLQNISHDASEGWMNLISPYGTLPPWKRSLITERFVKLDPDKPPRPKTSDPTVLDVSNSLKQQIEDNMGHLTLNFPLDSGFPPNICDLEILLGNYFCETSPKSSLYACHPWDESGLERSYTVTLTRRSFEIPPPFLCCTLNRFTERGDKIRSTVIVPDKLSLRKGWFKEQDGEHATPTYQLQSVILHLGSSSKDGHYVTMTRQGSYWYYCNDEEIQVLTDGAFNEYMQTHSRDIYLAFFEGTDKTQKFSFEGTIQKEKLPISSSRKRTKEAFPSSSISAPQNNPLFLIAEQVLNLYCSTFQQPFLSPDAKKQLITSLLEDESMCTYLRKYQEGCLDLTPLFEKLKPQMDYLKLEQLQLKEALQKELSIRAEQILNSFSSDPTFPSLTVELREELLNYLIELFKTHIPDELKTPSFTKEKIEKAVIFLTSYCSKYESNIRSLLITQANYTLAIEDRIAKRLDSIPDPKLRELVRRITDILRHYPKQEGFKQTFKSFCKDYYQAACLQAAAEINKRESIVGSLAVPKDPLKDEDELLDLLALYTFLIMSGQVDTKKVIEATGYIQKILRGEKLSQEEEQQIDPLLLKILKKGSLSKTKAALIPFAKVLDQISTVAGRKDILNQILIAHLNALLKTNIFSGPRDPEAMASRIDINFEKLISFSLDDTQKLIALIRANKSMLWDIYEIVSLRMKKFDYLLTPPTLDLEKVLYLLAQDLVTTLCSNPEAMSQFQTIIQEVVNAFYSSDPRVQTTFPQIAKHVSSNPPLNIRVTPQVADTLRTLILKASKELGYSLPTMELPPDSLSKTPLLFDEELKAQLIDSLVFNLNQILQERLTGKMRTPDVIAEVLNTLREELSKDTTSLISLLRTIASNIFENETRIAHLEYLIPSDFPNRPLIIRLLRLLKFYPKKGESKEAFRNACSDFSRHEIQLYSQLNREFSARIDVTTLSQLCGSYIFHFLSETAESEKSAQKMKEYLESKIGAEKSKSWCEGFQSSISHQAATREGKNHLFCNICFRHLNHILKEYNLVFRSNFTSEEWKLLSIGLANMDIAFLLRRITAVNFRGALPYLGIKI